MSDLGPHTGCGGQIRETGQHDLFPYACLKCGAQFVSFAQASDAVEKFEHLVWKLDEFSHTYYCCCVPADEAALYEKF